MRIFDTGFTNVVQHISTRIVLQAKKKGALVLLDEVIIHTKTKKHDDKTWVDPGHAELQAQFFELREEARQNGLKVTDEEIWYSLVEGHNAKNRVPGVGDYAREMKKINTSSKPRRSSTSSNSATEMAALKEQNQRLQEQIDNLTSSLSLTIQEEIRKLYGGDFKPAGKFKGQPAISFTDADVSALSSTFARTIVGRFIKGRPSLISTRKAFERIGFESDFSVSLLDECHILINFESEKDFLRCLLRKYWKINGLSLKVFRWTHDFDPNADSPLILVWIGLEGLPIHLFDSLALFSIGNLLGKPLKTDSATATLSRPSVARICVEIDTSKELPRSVWIHLGELTFLQPITYEDLPDYCPSCKSFGHKNCKRKIENSRWVKTEGVKTVGVSRTGIQQAVPKPGVTPTTIEAVLQTTQGEDATGPASAAETTDSNGAAPPRVDMATNLTLSHVRDSTAHEPPSISIALETTPRRSSPTTNLRTDPDPIIASDVCEVIPLIPTANCPATCGISEVILVTPTNVQDDTLILEPDSPLLFNNELSRGTHNLSSKAALEGTQTVDTENKEEYIPNPSQINLIEFPVLTKELLEATCGAHTPSLEKEMEGTLSLSSTGNDEIPSDPMENKNPPPLLTNDAGSNPIGISSCGSRISSRSTFLPLVIAERNSFSRKVPFRATKILLSDG
ncbi:unnamed protein product [Cuscuta campestris]|uniref:DUF4283 domain-containing protein n=1 Tax=Cuscuta campestris TaxID=132261 RepID=A0A484MQN2_9ASTE|nr:unnamed protein product [Cuscuta campestris]